MLKVKVWREYFPENVFFLKIFRKGSTVILKTVPASLSVPTQVFYLENIVDLARFDLGVDKYRTICVKSTNKATPMGVQCVEQNGYQPPTTFFVQRAVPWFVGAVIFYRYRHTVGQLCIHLETVVVEIEIWCIL